MSTPETPSTMQWWVLPTIAKRPPFSPSISQSSQSGLERSSCCEKIRAARARSCCSEPGSGSGGVPHVVGEVEVRVVDPDRAAHVEGHEAKLLAKARDQVQTGLDVVAELDV